MADLSGRTLGGFVLREPIGEGGYSVVYRCEQPLLNRDAAIKVLNKRRRRNDLAQERFLREARLASRLKHPYAAHIYAFGVEKDDGLFWIAMELVKGITLNDWLRQRGPMPLEQFVPFFECIAQVVQAAHERGIVHRDLKPSNVMVIDREDGPYPKLLDFGIAKMTDAAPPVPETWPDGSLAGVDEPVDAPVTDGVRTRTRPAPKIPSPANRHQLTGPGAWIGSRPYMSPEQWSAPSAVGPATDIYSLGVVAYEALTGRVPFTGVNSDEYYQRHLKAPVPSLGGDFAENLDRVVRRALAKAPQGRHSNVLELAAELRTVLRTEPREQLRSLTQQWRDSNRSPDLLSRGQVLADLERCARTTSKVSLSEPERSYLAASQRSARRSVWVRRSLVTFATMGLFGFAVMQIRLAQEQTRTARQVAEATVTQAELEQGRSALLHNEPEALIHLAEAYRRDHSPPTAFMWARALQSRLAEQARLASSAGRTWSATFSPDGQRIVTTDDKNAQVWDAQTYRLLFTLPHGDTVYQAVYSSDGSSIVTAGGDGTVRIWDANGRLVRELRRDGTKSRYYAVAISPDGKLVAAIELAGVVAHVWDASTGAPLAELRNDASGFPSLAFSSDGQWLATNGGDDVRVFDTRTWAHALTIAGPGVSHLSWDPTGPHLLTGSAEGDASIWAIPSGQRIHHLREIGEPVDAVAFSPDGQLVVAASRDGAEQVWNATSGKLQNQGNYLRGKILSIEFDRTSRLVLAAGASGSVVVADAARGMPVSVLDGPRNVVMVAHFDPNARRVVGASWDGTARVWDATAPYLRWSSTPISDDCGLVTSLEPDRRFVAIGCIDHPTRIWDTDHAQLLAELPSVTQVDGDFASAFPAVSAAGDRAAIARGNTVEIYELPGDRLLRTIPHGAAVNAVAFATTGHDLVSGAVDGSLLVTRDDAEPLAFAMSPNGIDAAGFLPDGRVVAGAGKRLRVYDPGGVVLADLQVIARVRTLRMSLDSRRLITVPSYLGEAAPPELWDLEHYQPIARLDGQGQVYSARFVAGGQILTACGDGAARLWDGATGQLRQTYRGGSRFLLDATLSPDGAMVLAGGGDGLLRFWDAASGRPLWTMQAHRSYLVGLRVDGDDIITRGFSGDISRWRLPKPEQVIDACNARDRCAIVSQ